MIWMHVLCSRLSSKLIHYTHHISDILNLWLKSSLILRFLIFSINYYVVRNFECWELHVQHACVIIIHLTLNIKQSRSVILVSASISRSFLKATTASTLCEHFLLNTLKLYQLSTIALFNFVAEMIFSNSYSRKFY